MLSCCCYTVINCRLLCFFSWFELRIEAEQYYSIPVPDIKKHCARGKKNYQGIDASKASVPERFLKRFNKVPIPTLITPTCHSGYVGLDGC